jgi:hypothetical protein
MERIWEEVSFTLEPKIDINAVADAFKKFYAGYNPWGGPFAEAHRYTSDGSVMLHAESGGKTFDTVDMYLMEWGAGECTARFCAAGSLGVSMDNQYAQVKKFFTELSDKLLQVQHWGEPVWATQEKRARRICQNCGAPACREDASFCWQCGADMTAEEAAGPTPIKTPTTSPKAAGGNLRTCMVCQLGFRQGDLLAWCPFCGAAAHRVHLLEYLHVNGKCPACSHHLEETDLAQQFKQAWLQVPRKPRE